MEGIKIIAFAFILWGFQLCTVQSNSCTIESKVFGKIVGGGYFAFHQGCWTVPVPLGHFIHLQLISLVSERSCEKDYLRINIAGTSDVHKFCSSDSSKNPITALGNITLTHITSGYDYYFTSFTLEYTVMPIICIYGNSFRCDSSSCISKDKVCDGVKDCKNGADEIGCETVDCMNNNTFKCDNDSCIPKEKVCDGVKHCENGADEIGCDTLQSHCKEETEASGQIVVAGSFQSKQECWTIPVKLGEFIHLKFIAFMSKHSCKEDHVRINIEGKNDVYKFCYSDYTLNPIAAYGNVTVIHNISAKDSKYSSFNIEYNTIPLDTTGLDVTCLDINNFRCDNNSCVPKEKVCDGVEDCKNGADEIGCEKKKEILPIKGISEAREKAISWLKQQRTASWGWRENTPRATIALYLAGGASFNGTILEEELMAKQNELRTAVALLRPSLTNSELNLFINALLVTCHNPRQFYGKNLVKRLKDQMEESGNFTHPLVYLTLCNANESWPEKATSDINNILNSSSDYSFVKDLQAMAVMALSCAAKRRIMFNYNTETLYKDTIQHFKTLRAEDGSFGNVYTTALITQALLSSVQEHSNSWNLNATIKYLMQELNSSSVDFLATYFALPVLNGKSLMDISFVNCSANPRNQGDDPVAEITDFVGPKMRVQYSLYIGDEKDIVHTISFRAPKDYTASKIMELAAEADSKYKFQWKMTSGKMYVYEIASVKNDPEAGKFWLLYVGAANSSEPLTHLTKGPDEVILGDDEHLVLWYKSVTI